MAARLPGSGGAPMGLAVLPDGGLVTGDFGRDRLYRVDAPGSEPALYSDGGLAGPENVAIHPAF